MVDEIKIETITTKKGEERYSKQCPFNVNTFDEESETESINKVGSKRCSECRHFVKIQRGYVYCI